MSIAKTLDRIGVVDPEKWIEEHAPLLRSVVLAEGHDPDLGSSPVGKEMLSRLRKTIGDAVSVGRELEAWTVVMRDVTRLTAEKRAAAEKAKAEQAKALRKAELEKHLGVLADLKADVARDTEKAS